MWKELERGFAYCTRFDPKYDMVRGLEPDYE